MQTFSRCVLRNDVFITRTTALTFRRNASLTRAIDNGIRRTKTKLGQAEKKGSTILRDPVAQLEEDAHTFVARRESRERDTSRDQDNSGVDERARGAWAPRQSPREREGRRDYQDSYPRGRRSEGQNFPARAREQDQQGFLPREKAREDRGFPVRERRQEQQDFSPRERGREDRGPARERRQEQQDFPSREKIREDKNERPPWKAERREGALASNRTSDWRADMRSSRHDGGHAAKAKDYSRGSDATPERKQDHRRGEFKMGVGAQGSAKSTNHRYTTDAPESIHYTTAASEFLYGTFAVKAALQAGRRSLYRLYVYRTQVPTEQPEHENDDPAIRKLAKAAGVEVLDVAGPSWRSLMNKMTKTRPHNGYVLEASPLPKLPLTKLEPVDQDSAVVSVELASEDKALTKAFVTEGLQAEIPWRKQGGRFPFLLMLDRILDPGNLGAILRSAYFLGVDGVIVIGHGSAPLTEVAIKASAGAAEYVPIMTVQNDNGFISMSRENGWKFFAAVAPESASVLTKEASMEDQQLQDTTVLLDHPCVLLLGSEGEGLRPRLQRKANAFSSIRGDSSATAVVDSLNVSVAAALLTQRFLSATEAKAKPALEAPKEPQAGEVF